VFGTRSPTPTQEKRASRRAEHAGHRAHPRPAGNREDDGHRRARRAASRGLGHAGRRTGASTAERLPARRGRERDPAHERQRAPAHQVRRAVKQHRGCRPCRRDDRQVVQRAMRGDSQEPPATARFGAAEGTLRAGAGLPPGAGHAGAHRVLAHNVASRVQGRYPQRSSIASSRLHASCPSVRERHAVETQTTSARALRARAALRRALLRR
jgi:hypothetical protein